MSVNLSVCLSALNCAAVRALAHTHPHPPALRHLPGAQPKIASKVKHQASKQPGKQAFQHSFRFRFKFMHEFVATPQAPSSTSSTLVDPCCCFPHHGHIPSASRIFPTVRILHYHVPLEDLQFEQVPCPSTPRPSSTFRRVVPLALALPSAALLSSPLLFPSRLIFCDWLLPRPPFANHMDCCHGRHEPRFLTLRA
ncbi:hypothetical protein BKA61DRAFT_293322 [Leptodontidium sp. MPI-SDFR-AT-0119]|nr:hypothetical protein BKA61DRAFT_293322 [Leptodontidium sp. MPI-SDFR-AT-0119]